jgi:hypothetical protein
MSIFELFEHFCETIKSVLPKGAIVADPIHQGRERLRPGVVVGLATFAAMGNQFSAPESTEVLGNHRL